MTVYEFMCGLSGVSTWDLGLRVVKAVGQGVRHQAALIWRLGCRT